MIRLCLSAKASYFKAQAEQQAKIMEGVKVFMVEANLEAYKRAQAFARHQDLSAELQRGFDHQPDILYPVTPNDQPFGRRKSLAPDIEERSDAQAIKKRLDTMENVCWGLLENHNMLDANGMRTETKIETLISTLDRLC